MGFNGIEVAKNAILTQRSAITTTGHNISNVNTEGYSRQRVNLAETTPMPVESRNKIKLPGQLGTGVEAGTVQRIRDQFFDFQYRNENSKIGYYETKADSLQRIENVMTEPSRQGLSETMNKFWQSLQDLSVDPSHSGTRAVVRERGIAVADTFNYLSETLQSMQQEKKTEMDAKVNEVNDIANKINQLNREISDLENNGYLPNDLYDTRDQLVDQLSEIVNVKVTTIKSGQGSMAIADGVYSIEIVDDDGYSLFGGDKLVNGSSFSTNELQLNEDGKNGSVHSISLGSSTIDAHQFQSKGELQALIESYGYENENGDVAGIFPNMLAKLDNMAYIFAAEFNKVHKDGNSLHEIDNGPEEILFFSDAINDRVASYPKDTTDIVFVVDNSGTMSPKLESVAEKLGDFADAIKGGTEREIQFGLVKYVEDNKAVNFEGGDRWTTDVSKIQEAIQKTDLDGSQEDLLGAINNVLPLYGDQETFKHIVFITDEGDFGNLAAHDVIDQFTNRGIQIHGIYPPNTYNVEDLTNITDQSGGVSLDIEEDDWPDDLVNVLGTSIKDYIETAGNGEKFFKEGFASRISVSQDILNDIDKIAAANGDSVGDGSNANELADVGTTAFSYDASNELADFRSYYESVIGSLGVESKEAQRLERNADTIRQSVNERRQSISSVSLDEEMARMIEFQHAYNAAARNMTVMDEVLDRIINQLG
ncbi:flagellar hook-associated protein FlgK [Oceanobacillus limi]|uniref:Flagellar hook-associated protein 1 n=1 Tax=Oceanobacillus limi TaxID=930131 RepID=A0A1I0AG70_9BACI|nr:flagellar hook-associated protein FlgK [Oceanobacillus limi]SES92253.1 flagellar hook-associated protein FlgK [Oceanobacillus limi]